MAHGAHTATVDASAGFQSASEIKCPPEQPEESGVVKSVELNSKTFTVSKTGSKPPAEYFHESVTLEPQRLSEQFRASEAGQDEAPAKKKKNRNKKKANKKVQVREISRTSVNKSGDNKNATPAASEQRKAYLSYKLALTLKTKRYECVPVSADKLEDLSEKRSDPEYHYKHQSDALGLKIYNYIRTMSKYVNYIDKSKQKDEIIKYQIKIQSQYQDIAAGYLFTHDKRITCWEGYFDSLSEAEKIKELEVIMYLIDTGRRVDSFCFDNRDDIRDKITETLKSENFHLRTKEISKKALKKFEENIKELIYNRELSCHLAINFFTGCDKVSDTILQKAIFFDAFLPNVFVIFNFFMSLSQMILVVFEKMSFASVQVKNTLKRTVENMLATRVSALAAKLEVCCEQNIIPEPKSGDTESGTGYEICVSARDYCVCSLYVLCLAEELPLVEICQTIVRLDNVVKYPECKLKLKDTEQFGTDFLSRLSSFIDEKHDVLTKKEYYKTILTFTENKVKEYLNLVRFIHTLKQSFADGYFSEILRVIQASETPDEDKKSSACADEITVKVNCVSKEKILQISSKIDSMILCINTIDESLKQHQSNLKKQLEDFIKKEPDDNNSDKNQKDTDSRCCEFSSGNKSESTSAQPLTDETNLQDNDECIIITAIDSAIPCLPHSSVSVKNNNRAGLRSDKKLDPKAFERQCRKACEQQKSSDEISKLFLLWRTDKKQKRYGDFAICELGVKVLPVMINAVERASKIYSEMNFHLMQCYCVIGLNHAKTLAGYQTEFTRYNMALAEYFSKNSVETQLDKAIFKQGKDFNQAVLNMPDVTKALSEIIISYGKVLNVLIKLLEDNIIQKHFEDSKEILKELNDNLVLFKSRLADVKKLSNKSKEIFILRGKLYSCFRIKRIWLMQSGASVPFIPPAKNPLLFEDVDKSEQKLAGVLVDLENFSASLGRLQKTIDT